MRLIDIDKAIAGMQFVLDENQDKKDSVAYFAFESIITALKQEPTADAVEVVHGRWIEDEIERKDDFPLHMYQCSNCGGIAYHHKFSYCPNCGAKMDGEMKKV